MNFNRIILSKLNILNIIPVHLFLCYILLAPFCLYSQPQNIRFSHFTIKDGLSQNSVLCVFQDSRGFMWFGTEDGLNQFDGYKFTVFKHDPNNTSSISNNYVTAICEDSSGYLWIGTDGGGLNRFDIRTKQFIHFKNDPLNSNSISDNSIIKLILDQQGNFWIGTLNGGLNRYNSKTNQFLIFKNIKNDVNSLSANCVVSLLIDHDKNLWVGTEGGGLNRFNRKTKKITRYRHDQLDHNSISNNDVLSIIEDDEQNLWIGTSNGLNCFDRKTEQFFKYFNEADNPHSLSNNIVYCVHQDKDKTLWVGTINGGLNCLNRRTQQFTRYKKNPANPWSLSSDLLSCIYEDNHGGIWFGTWGGGVNRVDLEAKKFNTYFNDPGDPNSVSSGLIQSFCEDHSGNLWIGISNGLDRIDNVTQQFSHYQISVHSKSDRGENDVRAIFEDSDQKLWVGTYYGLYRLNQTTDTFNTVLFNHELGFDLRRELIWSIFEDSSTDLWISTRNGLLQYNRSGKDFVLYENDPDDPGSLGENDVRVVYEDKIKQLWIGTYRGVYRWDHMQKRFVALKDMPDVSSTLEDKIILCFYQFDDEAGEKLWIGTINGLFHYDCGTGRYIQYLEKDGLPSSIIIGILEDEDGNLWISTTNGLVKYSRQDSKFRVYDETDGLVSDEFRFGAFYKKQNGEMLFGGIDGWEIFDPSKIKDNPYTPKVAITDFQIYNQSIDIGKVMDGRVILEQNITETSSITLAHRQRVFSFEFTALHYASPGKNKYAYMLEGLEKNWNYVDSKRRFATYTNLGSGTYIFKVKATNNDGYWSDEITNVIVKILPPPWKTWWAYFLYMLILICIVLWFIQSQRRQVKRKQKEIMRLQSIFDNTTSVMYMKDLKGRYIMVNRRYEELNNISKEEVVNKTVYDVFPSETAAVLAADDLKVLEKNIAMEFEEQIMLADGLHTYISVRFPLRDPDNNPYAVCGISTDITERKKAEEEMQHLRNMLSNIINSMPSALVGVDMESRITQWNNGAEEITGITAEKARGKLIDEVFPDLHVQMSKIKKAITQRQIQRDLKVKQERENKVSFCDIIIFPLVSNGVEGAVIRVDDVTDRVRIEEMMIQSEKMISVGGLAAGMAHEINNPLAGIIQTMQVIQNRVSNNIPKNLMAAEKCGISFDKLVEYHKERGLIEMMKTVLESARRAATIVDNMLSFSRKSESKCVLVNIKDLMDKTIDLCSSDYDMKKNYDFRDLEIIKEYGTDLPLVPCEASKIQQVILNLLKNGAQAMQKENEKLKMENGEIKKFCFMLRLAEDEQENMIRIEIEDNGPGMDEATRRRIFEPFFTTKAAGAGTGLGLSVSYFIVTENHGGEMWVESIPGEGSKFVIRLPLSDIGK
ncbi:PAS domain S-box protein [bacterium]|nr:PAS domain S-box protein [bacterium]